MVRRERASARCWPVLGFCSRLTHSRPPLAVCRLPSWPARPVQLPLPTFGLEPDDFARHDGRFRSGSSSTRRFALRQSIRSLAEASTRRLAYYRLTLTTLRTLFHHHQNSSLKMVSIMHGIRIITFVIISNSGMLGGHQRWARPLVAGGSLPHPLSYTYARLALGDG